MDIRIQQLVDLEEVMMQEHKDRLENALGTSSIGIAYGKKKSDQHQDHHHQDEDNANAVDLSPTSKSGKENEPIRHGTENDNDQYSKSL